MEKRLFVAIALSLGVVFAFQAFFAPKRVPEANTATSTNTVVQAPASKDTLSVPSLSTTEKSAIKEETWQFDLGKFHLTVSNVGGSIQKVYLKDQHYEFPVAHLADVALAADRKFTVVSKFSDHVDLVSDSTDISIKKTISTKNNNLNVIYKIFSKSISAKLLDTTVTPLYIDLSRLDINASKSDWTLFEYGIKINSKVERKEHVSNFSDKWNKMESKDIEWISFRDRYFVTIVKPEVAFKKYETKSVSDKILSFTAGQEPVLLEPGQSLTLKYEVYAGPQLLETLQEAGKGFDKVLVFSSWFWLDAIAKGIYFAMQFIHKLLPIWGLCIVLISALIYGVMYPLTFKSMLSMKKMQALQPQINKLKEKYKDSPEKMNKEVVELYRVNNVNPLSGCLPLLLQMPIFVGLYQVLWRSFYFRGEGFLWIKDLSMPDQLFKFPVEIPFLGSFFNVLPILMIGIMLVQQMITLKGMTGGDPEQVSQQKFMAIFFPIFLGFIFYNFSSGLNLYFVVFYLLSTISQLRIAAITK